MSALDELRFGGRILNLRESLPTAAVAVQRAERFLREQQIRGSADALVITGRGNNSPDGIAVLRDAVEKLLFSLRRQGVVQSFAASNPGAFIVTLAPLRQLVDAIPRDSDRPRRTPMPAVHGLSPETNDLLRSLAARSLDELGVRQDDTTLEAEMHRHLRALAPSLPGGDSMETVLQRALRAAIDEYDR